MKTRLLLAIHCCLLLGGISWQSATDATETVEEYGSFPKNWCSLPHAKEEAIRLMANDLEEAQRLSEEMKAMIKIDPEFAKLSKSDAEKYLGEQAKKFQMPYNYNRLGRENTSICLLASEVHTEYQEFILACCPRSQDEFIGELSYFLDKIDSQGIWVSLLTSNEAETLCNNFWKEDFLRRLALPNGWVITDVNASLIAGKDAGPDVPALIKTRIELRCGEICKTILHYHYEGWHDITAVPDEDIFSILLDEMEENSTKEVPIVVNCIGGVGRTGMTVVSYLLRKEVQEKLAQGVAPENIVVNVPQIIYTLRKQRSGLASNAVHIYKIYSVLGRYCENGLLLKYPGGERNLEH